MPSKAYAVLASPYFDVCLVNVRVEGGRLFAGFAYFEGGGLPEQITVFPPKRPLEKITIWIPAKARAARTHVILTSADDAIMLRIADQTEVQIAG